MVVENDGLGGESIERRRADLGVPVRPDVVAPKRVADYENDVRAVVHRGRTDWRVLLCAMRNALIIVRHVRLA